MSSTRPGHRPTWPAPLGRAPTGERLRPGHSVRSLEDDNLSGRADDHRMMAADGPRRADAIVSPSKPLWSRCWCPNSAPCDIVVMDNLSSHNGPAVFRAIAAAGARRSTFRPTALTSSHQERLCQAAGAAAQGRELTVDGLWDAVGHISDLFTPSECANEFAAADTSRNKTNPPL